MKKFLVIVLGMLFVFGLSTMSWAGAELKISDTTKATVGFKGLIWAQMLEDALKASADKGYEDKIDFSVRQIRLYASGQITPLLKFGTNLDWAAGEWDGSTGSTRTPTLTDGNITLDFAPEIKVLAGLYRTPFSRLALEDSYGFILPHGPEIAHGGYVGSMNNYRNAGLTIWGEPLGGKIKYGVGVFDGDYTPRKNTTGGLAPADDSLFYSARIAISPLDPEKGYVNPGTYLGKKKGTVLTVGAGYLAAKYRIGSPSSSSTTYTTTISSPGTSGEKATTTASTTSAGATSTTAEPNYSAYTVDLFSEIPLGGGALNIEAAYLVYDRDITDGETKGWYATVAYLIPGVNLQPAFRYEESDRDGTVTGGEDFTTMVYGLNYYMKGHNAKINLEYLSKNYENEGTTPRSNQDYSDLLLQIQFQF